MGNSILKINKLNLILLFFLLHYGCSTDSTIGQEKNTNAPVEASRKENLLQVVFNSLQEYSLPGEPEFSTLPRKCLPVDNEIFITNNIKIKDPGSFTVDEIDSKDLFLTADIFFCSYFDISKKYQAVLAKVEDKATAISKSVYLLIFEKNSHKPVSGIALSYEMTTPQDKRILLSELSKDLTLKIIEKKIDIETNEEETLVTSLKIDTLQGTFIKL